MTTLSPHKVYYINSETLPQNQTMAEETRWCHSCKKDRPKDLFRAPEDAGKEFWKMCEPCRIKYRNISRARRSQGGGGRARPYYLPEPAPQTNIRISNSQAGMASESTSATPTTTAPEQPKCLYPDSGHHSRVTVTPPVVETSAQSTTTTTVITISTITSKNVTETSIKVEEDTKTAQSAIQQVEDENPESLSSGPESEQQSEASSGANQRPELFACLHCERLRPWPMAGLHICLLCIRDWKWCAKGAHNQAKPVSTPSESKTGPPLSKQISDFHVGNLVRLNPAVSLARDEEPFPSTPFEIPLPPMISGTQQFGPDSRVRKGPSRQSRSCKVCRLRKVKCDRVKPCHACCAHGYPSKCVYEHVPDEEARPISQAEEIRNLRAEIRELRARIDDKQDGSGAQDLHRLDKLESLFESIRSAPDPLVDDLVRDIRTAHVGLKKDLVPVGPWEGREAYESYDYPSRPSSTLPVRNRLLINSPVEDFNNLHTEDDDDSDSERMSLNSGSDSSGTISVMGMQRPAVDVFVERFVDAFSPEVDIKSGRAGALRAAAGIRMFSPLITDAFEAVSVAFFGRSVQNKQIEASGFRLYPRVLRSLQDALVDPEKSKAESTLVTVILLLAFESVERTTQSGVSAHVRGAVRLIEHRGPESHMYGVEHLLFTELRPYWIGAALAARQPSFLARGEWKTIPWSAGTTQKDILHHLLDMATEVPGLLALSDAFKEAKITSVMGTQEMAVKQSTLWNGIRELTARFRQWYEDWVVAYPDGPPQEAEQHGDQGFPIFQRRDLRTGAIFTPTRFTYPNLLLAQTMCVYYAVRLILSSIDTRPGDRVSPMEQYDLGCGICRSLEFYILTAPGNMINRLAFPTRVAWEAFPDGGPERQFMVEVLQLVEKRHALGLWGSSMPELSTKESSPLNTGSP